MVYYHSIVTIEIRRESIYKFSFVTTQENLFLRFFYKKNKPPNPLRGRKVLFSWKVEIFKKEEPTKQLQILR